LDSDSDDNTTDPYTRTSNSSSSINNSNNNISNNNNNSFLRRQVITTTMLSFLSLSLLLSPPQAVHAFSNAVQPDYKKYADRPKRKGTPPKDLGVLSRTTEGTNQSITSPRLRICDGNPNCFSTTGDTLLEDRTQYGVDSLVPPWKYTTVPSSSSSSSSNSKNNPIQIISSIIKNTYEPGQGGIDGGGFSVIKETDTYLYYQFESLKKGYIDDVEFALSPSPSPPSSNNNNQQAEVPVQVQEVQVRSASRVGVTDFGVNAIRLNYIADKLKSSSSSKENDAAGNGSGSWSILEITPDTHRDYWTTANDAKEATFDEDRRNY